jgi:hypothetical protein
MGAKHFPFQKNGQKVAIKNKKNGQIGKSKSKKILKTQLRK